MASKKARCTGKQPCSLCVRSGNTCEYSAAYSRGRLPPIVSDESEISAATPAGSRTEVDKAGAPIPRQELRSPISIEHRHEPSSKNSPDQEAVESSRSSLEPPQTDLEGQYVGPSSGVAFLLRAQRRLHEVVTLSPNSSIFTFGDSPLPEYDPSFFVLPSRDDAANLVARYFDFAFPTHRFLHQQTVERYLQHFYDNLGDPIQKRGAREKNAVVLMVMAQAAQYMPAETSKEMIDAR